MKPYLLILSVFFILAGCSDNSDRTIQEEEDYPNPQRELPGINR